VIRTLWRCAQLLTHVLGGLWTIQRSFDLLTAAQRLQRVQQWSVRALQIMGIELRVSGEAHAPGPLLVVANHISWLDILVMNAVRPARFVSKADVKQWPLLGTLITGAGTLYIERESRRDAMRVVHHMAQALIDGDVLAVFPEGTTGDGVSLLPFHANVLQAAIAAQAPVQAVALAYVDGATGHRSQAPTYIGDTTLLTSVWRTLSGTGLVACVCAGGARPAEGRDRRTWAADLQTDIQRMTQALVMPDAAVNVLRQSARSHSPGGR
jgi:1-acyl-sn-glycerol-3-phosphate acyltransferase